MDEDVLVQYVLMRDDLETNGKPWNRGSLIAQACHACISAVSVYSTDPNVIRYISPENLPVMRTVVLSVASETELNSYHSLLLSHGVNNHLFTEQPENIITCLATAPVQKSRIYSLVKNLKLFK
ncbi:hypothetical protein BEWA_006520 [Theileria equi strain WA]|uniref:peptidyl-tRNA hydrolase n=1 Tax=Theileria equi strain WA TaxID=1537102 RepID=L0B154_THEEQ|nr:hypothetical protein BEWA_006520 [Theileria equi strain WA]AFZ81243.1 hypothetical protein BEWA_006520 [Theileria equi strain WA]|eukprot:XP_004830909.1 hypothetical protein BEWA_006520 [Theileria equi strain WA]